MVSQKSKVGAFQILLYSVLLAVLLSAAAMWLYMRSVSILNEDLRSQLATYASLAAQQFTAEEIGRIHTEADMTSPLFIDLVERARVIKNSIPDVTYVYVMRRTDDPMMLEFVIEDDMLNSFEELDINNDGVIQEDEEVVVPGESYDISDVPFMQKEAFVTAIADEDITHDQWGSWISGYAPIFDDDGNAVAIVGVDMRAGRFTTLVHRVFSPIGVVAALVCIFLLTGAYGMSLLRSRLRFMEETEKRRRTLVRIASHKLGGPIASVRWWLELLDASMKKEDIAEAKQELESAAGRIADVATELEEAITSDDVSEEVLTAKLAEETKEGIEGKAA